MPDLNWRSLLKEKIKLWHSSAQGSKKLLKSDYFNFSLVWIIFDTAGLRDFRKKPNLLNR
jgi:hypothetical protein